MPVLALGKESPGCHQVHFHVMQSLRHNKWVLAAVTGNFESYQVTDVMSSNVELMVQYAQYLNEGRRSSVLDDRQIALLDQLKIKYEQKESQEELPE